MQSASSSSTTRQWVDLTADDAAQPTAREEQLQLEIATLRAQLQAQQSSTARDPLPRWLSRSAAEAALIDFLADTRAPADDVERCLQAFPVGALASSSASFHRACYETLLDDVSSAAVLATLLSKLEVLRRFHLPCPADVWRQQRKLECMELVCATLGQEGLGRLLAGLVRCLAPGTAAASTADLYTKLDGADMLLVARVMAVEGALTLSARRQTLIAVVHYARHGPLEQLTQELSALPAADKDSLVNSSHHGFPLLFQPLIGARPSGWLDRLRVLLLAGARADMSIYAPWNCSALHMLVYRTEGAAAGDRRSAAAVVREESLLVDAIRLLLHHGGRLVINLEDSGGRAAAVKQRTALVQAASGGHFRVCEQLLAAGAAVDQPDSAGQNALELLFYLKHSHLPAHRSASAAYSCMDLYALVNRHGLAAMLSDEMREDCKQCRTCRYLLASVEPEEEEQEEEEEEQEETSVTAGDAHMRSTTGQRLRLLQAKQSNSLQKLMQRMHV